MKALLVYEPSMGMRHDARILTSQLLRIYPSAEIFDLEVEWDQRLDYSEPALMPEALGCASPFDVAFFFEHLYGHNPLRNYSFARAQVFIPNIEWLLPQDEAEILRQPPDAIWYKNEFSRLMGCSVPAVALIRKLRVIGWTSEDPLIEESETKDFSLFLHVRGLSNQKGTDALINCWLANPGFPSLTIISSTHDGFKFPVNLKAAENLDLILRRVTSEELRIVQNRCGIHIYPCEYEGFGHSLNEARASGSVLVTTGGPPMDGFVEEGRSGFLIPVADASGSRIRRSRMFQCNPDRIADAVRSVSALSGSALKVMGEIGRAGYLRDRARLASEIRCGLADVMPRESGLE